MDDKADTALTRAIDIPAALGLLTRLPIPVDTEAAGKRGAAAGWAYPFAGLGLALLAWAVGWLALALTGNSGIAALMALTTLIVTTGAMHEDGLADATDGLWGGWDKARRLEIMKDSQIGTYGVLALGLSLLLRATALAGLVAAGQLLVALLITAPLSRAVMPVLMHWLPHARDGGLSHAVGRPTGATAALAGGLGLVPALFLWPSGFLIIGLAAAVGAGGVAFIAKVKIGGQTGDILGAAQQVTEIAVLLALLALA